MKHLISYLDGDITLSQSHQPRHRNDSSSQRWKLYRGLVLRARIVHENWNIFVFWCRWVFAYIIHVFNSPFKRQVVFWKRTKKKKQRDFNRTSKAIAAVCNTLRCKASKAFSLFAHTTLLAWLDNFLNFFKLLRFFKNLLNFGARWRVGHDKTGG